MKATGAFASLVLRHDRLVDKFDRLIQMDPRQGGAAAARDAALKALTSSCQRVWFRDDGFRRVPERARFDRWLWDDILPLASCVSLRCCGCPCFGSLGVPECGDAGPRVSPTSTMALWATSAPPRSTRYGAWPCRCVIEWVAKGAGKLAGAGLYEIGAVGHILDVDCPRVMLLYLVASLRSSLRSLDLSQCRPDDLPPRPLPQHMEESYSYGAAVSGDITDDRLEHFANQCGLTVVKGDATMTVHEPVPLALAFDPCCVADCVSLASRKQPSTLVSVGPGRVQLINNGPRFVLSAVAVDFGGPSTKTERRRPWPSRTPTLLTLRRCRFHRLCAKGTVPEPVDADVVARTVFCGMPCLVDAGFGHCGLSDVGLDLHALVLLGVWQ